MKKEVPRRSRARSILLTVGAVLFVLIFILPLVLNDLDVDVGNVALIPINGIITGDGASTLTTETISSLEVADYIAQAGQDPQIEAIILEINSPGGSAVASDEIAEAIKQSEKPVIAVIREVGASGGYWIASATDHIIANRMSITGSIGVTSSYVEFGGLFEKYGVGYERLVSGKYKDIGTPYRELSDDERALMQQKIDTIHSFFVEEVVRNRNLDEEAVRKLATGEIFLGVEAQQKGLVDQLGNIGTALSYLQETYGLEKTEIVVYQRQLSFLDLLSSVMSESSFHIGEGIGSMLVKAPASSINLI
ncbi:signal peptide peptidase SppA [Candidatus Woesearchaeota archaeon CG10_big_fil_rev_8_21_14_0_10_45_16]|nr:MAG: signal peptide peptidase SppA [Candidatus Woesearchaeota archaeon CG10_big_fil_rev_8_21_14_0_10_45_16]